MKSPQFRVRGERRDAPTTGTGGTGTAGRTQSFQYTTAPSGPGGTYSTADYRPQFEKDAQNNQTALTYNQFGETTAIGTPQGQGGTLHRSYQGDNTAVPAPDCGGKTGQLCTSTDGNGNTTTYSYTAGNVTTITPPAPLGVKTFSYDPAGRKISEPTAAATPPTPATTTTTGSPRSPTPPPPAAPSPASPTATTPQAT